ncbi:MAG: virulence protein RhuM/Fic/DOC family protein [Patescibacteria group bacterium]
MKKEKINKTNKIAIYQAKNGAIELRADSKMETVWATQAQIAEIFDIERSVITKHINNIIKTGELDENSVCAKIAQTATDGKIYNVNMYNLDVILAVGYRVNSLRATIFRKWATKTIREYITKGFIINKLRIKNNYNQFLEAINDIKKLIPINSNIDSASILELVTAFADTWLSLDAYDKDDLVTKGETKKQVILTVNQLSKFLDEFKKELIKKGEATDIFGIEIRKDVLAGIVGNVMQSFDGKALYPSVEEKAAHLLYFMIKNHPFIDGNKRSGAFAFVWFLKKAGLLEHSKITPPALTALTLFIAESDPKNKERMIKIVLQLLKQ